MAERRVTVQSRVGLHARPAALFVRAAGKVGTDVTVARVDGEPVDATSILAVLGLDVRHGEEVVLRAEGAVADTALDELTSVISQPEPTDA